MVSPVSLDHLSMVVPRIESMNRGSQWLSFEMGQSMAEKMYEIDPMLNDRSQNDHEKRDCQRKEPKETVDEFENHASG